MRLPRVTPASWVRNKSMGDNIMPAPGAGQTGQPDYESKAELARRLGVSTRTVENLMSRGLPYVAITRKLRRFPRVAVDQWLHRLTISRG